MTRTDRIVLLACSIPAVLIFGVYGVIRVAEHFGAMR